MPNDFETMAFEDLQTPALLLDPERMERNIARMRERMRSLQVGFRPHVKSAKSFEVIRRMLDAEHGPVTVSTLQEAEALAAAGFRDILYAVGLTPNKVARVEALRRRGVDLKVIVDNPEAAAVLSQVAGTGETPIPALIEVDSDGHRAGVCPGDVEALRYIAEQLRGGIRPAGVITHAGGSYASTSDAEIRHYARKERDAVLAAADILRDAGHQVDHVSLGSTPTALFAEDLAGVTEVRAGVFVFFDLVMAGIGACAIDDIALSVLASVNTIQRDRNRILVDAGWMAMSRDRGTAAQRVDQHYGIVCDIDGRPYPDLVMLEANQEHGVIGMRPGSAALIPDLQIGSMVRILPNHACATAAQHAAYHLAPAGGRRIEGRWERWRGW